MMTYKELSDKINVAIYTQDDIAIERLHDLLYAIKNIDNYSTREIKARMVKFEDSVKDL